MSTDATCLRENGIMAENLILLIISVALVIYLFFSLLRPEKF
jgi:K+-transporting ATPase KdpF subunit